MSSDGRLRSSTIALVPAAQYIRMSTEHQRYSPDSQRGSIAEFAKARGFEIVETYLDAGRSGLTLSGRPALKQLLADVLSGDAKFQAILVLDVSRWGRFQDIDQSAHYEYMCRAAGVQVHYCTEPFENDGNALSSIVKHMKRVMAAEYSRELSVKIARAQRHQAGLGFKQGGDPPLGMRRQVIDQSGQLRMILLRGQRKALMTDKVIYVRGPAQEIALVRYIFRLFLIKEMRLGQIESWLNSKDRKQANGKRWTTDGVRRVLTQTLYSGQYVFGRRSNNLGRPTFTPPSDWVTAEVMTQIIPTAVFQAVQNRLAAITRRAYSDDEIDEGLARLLTEKSHLSGRLIQSCAYLPSTQLIERRFGSLAAAFRRIEFEIPSRLKKKCCWPTLFRRDAPRRIAPHLPGTRLSQRSCHSGRPSRSKPEIFRLEVWLPGKGLRTRRDRNYACGAAASFTGVSRRAWHPLQTPKGFQTAQFRRVTNYR